MAGHIIATAPDGALLLDIATDGMVASYPALDPAGDVYIGSADGNFYDISGASR